MTKSALATAQDPSIEAPCALKPAEASSPSAAPKVTSRLPQEPLGEALTDRFEATLAVEDSPRAAVEIADRDAAVAPSPKERRPRLQGEDKRLQFARSGHDVRDGLRSRRALLALSGALLTLSAWSGRANLVKPVATDPRNRSEALSIDETGWTASMDEEFRNHETNASWEWVRCGDVPRGRHLIKLVWVFKVKRDGRLKSRLCVQGCAQTAGVDYDQTHSATLQSPSLRLLAGLAAGVSSGTAHASGMSLDRAAQCVSYVWSVRTCERACVPMASRLTSHVCVSLCMRPYV